MVDMGGELQSKKSCRKPSNIQIYLKNEYL